MNLYEYGKCHAYDVRVDCNGLSRMCPLQAEILQLSGKPLYAAAFYCPHYRHNCPIESVEIDKALEGEQDVLSE
jgi:hypothetical protein